MTNKSTNILISLILFLSSHIVHGQISHTIDMYPKTPDASSASKYADIPSGNYTGVANFTIPIYTIKTKGGVIPIELTYTTTGIKVGEIASRVGLGWSLNTGASLSQQIMGRLDNKEMFKKPTLYDTSDIEICNDMAYPYNDPCGIAFAAVGISNFSNTTAKPDLLPDIFSYSLLNGSGQFIMDYSGAFGIPRPYNLTKIKPILTSYVEGFEMTDEKGINYTFQNHFFDLKHYNSCMNSTNPIDTDTSPNYKIKTIKFPNNEMINYIFGKSTNANYITSISEQKNIYNRAPNGGQGPYYTLPAEDCTNTTHSNDSALTEISFEEGKVLFYYNNDTLGFTEATRQDLIGDVYLTRIIVKDKSNHTIKDISLVYDYFTSQNENENYSPEIASDSPDVFKRLKLTDVKDNLSLEKYKLSYYGDDTGKTLPNRLSYSQDFWGVYNGQPNLTGIATVQALAWNNIVRVYNGANKKPDITFGIVGNLQSIRYPNGGNTEIYYEADDYLKNLDPPIYTYSNKSSVESIPNSTPISFEILTNNTYNQRIELIDTNCPLGSMPPVATYETPKWELHKLNANNQYTLVTWGWMCTATIDREGIDGPGTYKLIVYSGGFINGRNLSAKYHWIETSSDNPQIRKTGTIRVQKIESNSLDNGKVVRKYTYVNPSTNQSSGRNAGEEAFVSLSYHEIPLEINGPWAFQYIRQLNRVNNPGWQTATVRGKAVGYEYVQDIYESSFDPNQNYKKQYKFKNEIDNQQSYNYMSPINISWPTINLDRGLLDEEKSFNKDGDTIRKNTYIYSNDYYFNQYATMNIYSAPYNSINSVIGKGLEIKIKSNYVSSWGLKAYEFNKRDFNITNTWIKNLKTTTTDYVNNQPAMITEQTTAYSTNSGQNRHTFPESQTSTVVGSENTSSQHFKYASDLASTETIAEQMILANIISIPIETEVIKNGKIISKTKTNFAKNAKTNNLILPVSVYNKDLQTTTMEKEIEYDLYDTKGNLVQYTTKSGIPTTIIWGYNQTFPIAKIEGATYLQVSSLATAIIAASDTDALQSPNNDETTFLALLDTFRKDLPAYQITTYTYDPLIGVRSITPPSGIREVYIYDTAHRLEKIIDLNGNILKEFKYKYKQ